MFRGLLAAIVALCACTAPGTNIPREDKVFASALQRYQRTRTLVDKDAVGAPEVPIFMMAEGICRYQLQFPHRGFGVYAAQAVAVALELPALQAVAGSLDLFALRLKSADGAVQLWETLLAWYTRTTLAPLTLYRLGWAYRNASASGFPRESGKEAFDELLLKYPQSPLVPLVMQANKVPWKSTEAATAWSVLPGLGQMYVGEYGNGAVRLAVALSAAAMIVAPVAIGYNRRSELEWRGDWPLLLSAVLGFVILNVDYTVSYEDAIRAVIQFNEREQARFEARHPEAP